MNVITLLSVSGALLSAASIWCVSHFKTKTACYLYIVQGLIMFTLNMILAARDSDQRFMVLFAAISAWTSIQGVIGLTKLRS